MAPREELLSNVGTIRAAGNFRMFMIVQPFQHSRSTTKCTVDGADTFWIIFSSNLLASFLAFEIKWLMRGQVTQEMQSS